MDPGWSLPPTRSGAGVTKRGRMMGEAGASLLAMAIDTQGSELISAVALLGAAEEPANQG